MRNVSLCAVLAGCAMQPGPNPADAALDVTVEAYAPVPVPIQVPIPDAALPDPCMYLPCNQSVLIISACVVSCSEVEAGVEPIATGPLCLTCADESQIIMCGYLCVEGPTGGPQFGELPGYPGVPSPKAM